MNAETLEALKASIEKWKRNAVAETPDEYRTSGDDCPLCEIFQPDNGEYGVACNGCPVAERTGQPFCRDTPYAAAARAGIRWDGHPGWNRLRESAAARARAEVSFLEILLPVPAKSEVAP